MVNPDDSDFRFAFPQPIQNPFKRPNKDDTIEAGVSGAWLANEKVSLILNLLQPSWV